MQCKTVSASVACACVHLCVFNKNTHTHTARHITGTADDAHAHRTQTTDRGEEKSRGSQVLYLRL